MNSFSFLSLALSFALPSSQEMMIIRKMLATPSLNNIISNFIISICINNLAIGCLSSFHLNWSHAHWTTALEIFITELSIVKLNQAVSFAVSFHLINFYWFKSSVNCPKERWSKQKRGKTSFFSPQRVVVISEAWHN